ncbi:MAG: hypothetical protein ACOH17_09930 [Cellulomonas sp.]
MLTFQRCREIMFLVLTSLASIRFATVTRVLTLACGLPDDARPAAPGARRGARGLGG